MSNAIGTPVEQDWRFAELVARTWMEPSLADRYTADPCAVLAEFGLIVTSRQDAPSLEPYRGLELIIEELEHLVSPQLTATGGACTTDDGGQDDDEAADAQHDSTSGRDPWA
jgi:putative thiazole/oxazole-modified microcin (TOMM)-like peptide